MLTSTVEINQCTDLDCTIKTKISWLQIDQSRDTTVCFVKSQHFWHCIWAGCYKLRIKVMSWTDFSRALLIPVVGFVVSHHPAMLPHMHLFKMISRLEPWRQIAIFRLCSEVTPLLCLAKLNSKFSCVKTNSPLTKSNVWWVHIRRIYVKYTRTAPAFPLINFNNTSDILFCIFSRD